MNRKQRLVRDIVLTDSTFEPSLWRGKLVWTGKCLHCGTRLVVSNAGVPLNGGTIEHMLPRTHGGTDELHNVALACSRCNNGKGVRLDHRDANDPQLIAMIESLRARRTERWRDPEHAPVFPNDPRLLRK